MPTCFGVVKSGAARFEKGKVGQDLVSATTAPDETCLSRTLDRTRKKRTDELSVVREVLVNRMPDRFRVGLAQLAENATDVAGGVFHFWRWRVWRMWAVDQTRGSVSSPVLSETRNPSWTRRGEWIERVRHVKVAARARSHRATSTGLRTGLVRRLFEVVEGSEVGKEGERRWRSVRGKRKRRLATSETGA